MLKIKSDKSLCKKSTTVSHGPRLGSRLEDGAAHVIDHVAWSRRDFITGLGATLAGTFMLGGTPIRAMAESPLIRELRAQNSNRVLVLVQLGGGNDGLNTVVPYENDIYYQERPNIAIDKTTAQSFAVGQDMGLHPSLNYFNAAFQEGNMALLQNVGYPDPNLSHFRSTDIWLTGSDSETVVQSGWLGRYLNGAYPDFEEERPDFPLGVQIGGVSSLIFQGPATNMGMSLINADFFERLANEGQLYSLENLPTTAFADEMAYVRSVANDSFIYAGAVQDASEKGINETTYPGNPLAQNLSIVARLIKGELGARIYHVTLGGFDTHANQVGAHANLLRNLSESIDAFMQDIGVAGLEEDVMVMTFSEFGRRVGQNGSQGTDHGTAAPLFIFGEGVKGGLFGNAPVLDDLDNAGNMKFEIDFRTVYATVLQNWFGVAPDVVADAMLGHTYEALGFVEDPAEPVSNEFAEGPGSFSLGQNYPNPVSSQTTIDFSLEQPGAVQIEVFDIQGRQVSELANGVHAAGQHRIAFDAGHLPSGTYLYRMVSPNGIQSRKMVVVR
ncbi:MAG: DUF1501 domain-containing protein [Bacteroidota bacterium]